LAAVEVGVAQASEKKCELVNNSPEDNRLGLADFIANAKELTCGDVKREKAIVEAGEANALNVTQTPTFFVNGRPLPSFGLEQLQHLVKDSLQTAY
jgi:protein-disulfide isomerase